MSSLNDVYYELSELDDRISEAKSALDSIESCAGSVESYVDDLDSDSNHIFKLKLITDNLLKQLSYNDEPVVNLIKEYLNYMLSVMNKMTNGETITIADDESLEAILVSMELEDVFSK